MRGAESMTPVEPSAAVGLLIKVQLNKIAVVTFTEKRFGRFFKHKTDRYCACVSGFSRKT